MAAYDVIRVEVVWFLEYKQEDEGMKCAPIWKKEVLKNEWSSINVSSLLQISWKWTIIEENDWLVYVW